VHTIPVLYDGVDLPVVAGQTGLAIDEVVARHTARTYTVYAVGFVPGFGYLGDLDPALVVPRRPTPRPRVPTGSVAIAGGHTAVYPLETPGGWHLIGRTSIRMFDAAADPPARLAVGDTVRFVVARAS
jgi:KipI family sensor histidine kinase inhibitor